MGQEPGEKGAGAVASQPTIPKSDRLPVCVWQIVCASMPIAFRMALRFNLLAVETRS